MERLGVVIHNDSYMLHILTAERRQARGVYAVSYTHLTLPTILLV